MLLPVGRDPLLYQKFVVIVDLPLPMFTVLSNQRLTSRHNWRSCDCVSCLRSVPSHSAPSQSAVVDASLSNVTLLHFALLNARSISNKSFILNELFISENIDFMFLTETWQRENEFIHLNELCPVGCSVNGMPRMARRGGGLAVEQRDSFICRVINSECFSSFESQMLKVGSSNVFYSVLIYRPPGPAGVFLTDFTDFLSSIIKLEKVLIIGDFTCNTAANLLSITDSFNFIQHVTGPTHIKGHTLDLVFSLGLDIVNTRVEDVLGEIVEKWSVFGNLSSRFIGSTLKS